MPLGSGAPAAVAAGGSDRTDSFVLFFALPCRLCRFDPDNGRVARIILVSIATAFVTFSLAMNWLT